MAKRTSGIGLKCTHCGRRIRAREHMAGRVVPCPSCNADVIVPTATAAITVIETPPLPKGEAMGDIETLQTDGTPRLFIVGSVAVCLFAFVATLFFYLGQHSADHSSPMTETVSNDEPMSEGDEKQGIHRTEQVQNLVGPSKTHSIESASGAGIASASNSEFNASASEATRHVAFTLTPPNGMTMPRCAVQVFGKPVLDAPPEYYASDWPTFAGDSDVLWLTGEFVLSGFNVRNGDLLKVIQKSQGIYWHCEVSPSGKYLCLPRNATGGTFGDFESIRFYDAEARTYLYDILLPATARTFQFLPKADVVVVAQNNGMIQFWDINAGKWLRAIYHPAGNVFSTSISRDGTRLAVCSHRNAIYEIPNYSPSADGVTVYRLDTGKLERTLDFSACGNLPSDGVPCRVEFTPDGSLAVSVRSGEFSGIQFWNASLAPTSFIPGKVKGERSYLSSMDAFGFPPIADSIIINVLKPDGDSALQRLCISTGELLAERPTPRVVTVECHQSQPVVAVMYGSAVEILNAKDLSATKLSNDNSFEHNGEFVSSIVNKNLDNLYATCLDGKIARYQFDNGEFAASVDLDLFAANSYQSIELGLSRQTGDLICVGPHTAKSKEPGTAIILCDKNTLVKKKKMCFPVGTCVHLDRSGEIAVVQNRRGITIVETEGLNSTRQAALRGNEPLNWQWAFSSSSRRFAGCEQTSNNANSKIFLFDTDDANLTPTLLRGHSNGVTEMEFSPDENFLATCSSADDRICLWDTTTADQVWAVPVDEPKHIGFLLSGFLTVATQEGYPDMSEVLHIDMTTGEIHQSWTVSGRMLQMFAFNNQVVACMAIAHERSREYSLVKLSNQGRIETFNTGVVPSLHSPISMPVINGSLLLLPTPGRLIAVDVEAALKSPQISAEVSPAPLPIAFNDDDYPSYTDLTITGLEERTEKACPPGTRRSSIGWIVTYSAVMQIEAILRLAREHLSEQEYFALVRHSVRKLFAGNGYSGLTFSTEMTPLLGDDGLENQSNSAIDTYRSLCDALHRKEMNTVWAKNMDPIQKLRLVAGGDAVSVLYDLWIIRQDGVREEHTLDSIAAKSPSQIRTSGRSSRQYISITQALGRLAEIGSGFEGAVSANSTASSTSTSSGSSPSRSAKPSGDTEGTVGKTLKVKLLQSNGSAWKGAALKADIGRGGTISTVTTGPDGIAEFNYSGSLPTHVRISFQGNVLKQGTWERDGQTWPVSE